MNGASSNGPNVCLKASEGKSEISLKVNEVFHFSNWNECLIYAWFFPG